MRTNGICKKATTLLTGLLLGTAAMAQYDMDQVLRIGYRLGSESFDPAYSLGTYDGNTNTTTVNSTYKDHMGLSNYEIWYCRYSPHAFYEANLDGMFNALANYISNSLHEYEKQFEKFKNCSKNGVAQVHGIDYDILNFKMGFGTHGIFLSGQYKWTRLGSYADNDPAPPNGQTLNSIGHSETNVRALGLGLNANLTVAGLVTQTHLMFNWLKGSTEDKNIGPFFMGKELEFESIISLGKGFGGYITPYFKKRMGSSDLHLETPYSHGFSSSFAFGIKLGIYLAQEADDGDAYITVE